MSAVDEACMPTDVACCCNLWSLFADCSYRFCALKMWMRLRKLKSILNNFINSKEIPIRFSVSRSRGASKIKKSFHRNSCEYWKTQLFWAESWCPVRVNLSCLYVTFFVIAPLKFVQLSYFPEEHINVHNFVMKMSHLVLIYCAKKKERRKYPLTSNHHNSLSSLWILKK